MSQSKEEIVWESTLDGHYQIRVVRSGEYTGVLGIVDQSDNDNVLLSETVNLAYGALFGPDVSDVMSWKEKALDVVDSQKS